MRRAHATKRTFNLNVNKHTVSVAAPLDPFWRFQLSSGGLRALRSQAVERPERLRGERGVFF